VNGYGKRNKKKQPEHFGILIRIAGRIEIMDDLTGLEELHKTIADASEQLATFISCGNSGEVAIPSLIVAAEKTLSELAKWRAGLSGVLAVNEKAH
jgi:hypothetical protein